MERRDITLDGTTFTTYHHREDTRDSAVVVDVWVDLDASTMGDLRQEIATRRRDYFPVTLDGWTEPRSMRFGLPGWSKHDDRYKVHLILVEELYDSVEHEPPVRINPEVPVLVERVAWLSEFTERLVGRMVARGVMDETEIAEIRREADDARRFRQIDFYERQDVDELIRGG